MKRAEWARKGLEFNGRGIIDNNHSGINIFKNDSNIMNNKNDSNISYINMNIKINNININNIKINNIDTAATQQRAQSCCSSGPNR